MLSVLIPTYNHSVYNLVEKLDQQLRSVDCQYEIIVIDDHSSVSIPENDSITAFKQVKFQKLNQNIGRSAIRRMLAEQANYNMLLFLDADVLPVSDTFISNYIETIQNQRPDVVFGGIAYVDEKPSKNEVLRWEYGRKREVQPVSVRQQRPHFIITQNVLITKPLFLNLDIPKENFYGDDLVFSQQLKQRQIKVKHIDNPVFHLGLETSEKYLEKAMSAVKSIVELERKELLDTNFTKLQQTYLKIKKTGTIGVFKWFITPKKEKIKQNLLSENPNLRWFDLYRLSYYIDLKSEADA